METDSKRALIGSSLPRRAGAADLLCPWIPSVDTEDGAKQAKITNQRERQASALALARQTTTLLERTRLNVRIYCQAIHAKVPRHMLIDMIDYLEPTLVLVGSRGLTKLKGCVQSAFQKCAAS